MGENPRGIRTKINSRQKSRSRNRQRCRRFSPRHQASGLCPRTKNRSRKLRRCPKSRPRCIGRRINSRAKRRSRSKKQLTSASAGVVPAGQKQEPEPATISDTRPLYDEDIPSKGGISLPRTRSGAQLDPAESVRTLLEQKICRLQNQLLNKAARRREAEAALPNVPQPRSPADIAIRTAERFKGYHEEGLIHTHTYLRATPNPNT